MKRNVCISLVPLALGLLLFTSVLEAQIACIEPDKTTGASKAVVVDPAALAHTTQVWPYNQKGELVGAGDVRKQTEQVFDNLDQILRHAKSNLGQVVKLNVYVARADLSDAVSSVMAKRFSGKIKPAVTYVGGDLVHPDALVAMDAVAVSTLKIVGPALHFKAEGGNDSVVTLLPPTGAVYVAGLADTNKLELATRTTLGKIESAIGHLGLNRRHIVQLKAFVQPMSEVSKVKSQIAEYFKGEVVPPVTYVDWISASVPVEIEAIVAAPTLKSEQMVSFHTPPGATASPVYSRLARVHSGKRIYISGLYGNSEPGKDAVDIYRQLDELIEKTGSSRDHLVKATYYYSDKQSNSGLDAFRPQYYNPKTPPTASKAKVKDVGRVGKGIVIDFIGVTK